jgi:hypothetical protein
VGTKEKKRECFLATIPSAEKPGSDLIGRRMGKIAMSGSPTAVGRIRAAGSGASALGYYEESRKKSEIATNFSSSS